MAPSGKGKTNQCIVQCIDSIIALNITADTTGQQLIDMIFEQYNIFEKHWFGLMYVDNKDVVRWLDLTKKVNIKEVKPNSETSAHFKFTIKYYPESIKVEIIQDLVKVLFFKHELSRLVGDVDCECLPEHRVLCAVAYAHLIAHEQSNYKPEDVIKKKFDRLFPPHVLKQFNMTKEEWLETINTSLELSKGQHYTEPLMHALDAMEQSPMYGISYFRITNKNGTDLLLGVDCYGLTIYKSADRVNPCIMFQWNEIHNVSYTGKAFHIRPVLKEDPELVIYTKSARQNDEILSLIAGNHMNYLRRRKMDEELEQEIKAAKKAQEAQDLEKKRFEQQKEANNKYENAVENILISNDEEKEKKLQEEFVKTKMLMEEKIAEAKKEAEEEQRQRKAAEKGVEELRKHAEELEKRLQNDEKIRQEMALIDGERALAEAARQAEVNALTQQLKELELRHQEDLKRLAELEKKGASELPPAPKVVNVTYNESKQQKDTEIKAHINKVGAIFKERNIDANSSVTKIQNNAAEGKTKFETLKQLRKNNTKARVDEFESY